LQQCFSLDILAASAAVSTHLQVSSINTSPQFHLQNHQSAENCFNSQAVHSTSPPPSVQSRASSENSASAAFASTPSDADATDALVDRWWQVPEARCGHVCFLGARMIEEAHRERGGPLLILLPAIISLNSSPALTFVTRLHKETLIIV
jgi:hypothetical protein